MLDAIPHRLDDPGALMTEQDGQPVCPARSNYMQIGVTDAARLDADERFAGSGLIQLEFLDPELADLG